MYFPQMIRPGSRVYPTCEEMLSKWFFMHLIAWYLPSFTFCALSTSLNVPSPFFATSRYLRISHRARTPLAASHCPFALDT